MPEGMSAESKELGMTCIALKPLFRAYISNIINEPESDQYENFSSGQSEIMGEHFKICPRCHEEICYFIYAFESIRKNSEDNAVVERIIRTIINRYQGGTA